MTSGSSSSTDGLNNDHPNPARCRVVVLISGNGSNLQAMLDLANKPYDIVAVLSNKDGAYGLRRAADAGISTHVVPHTAYPDRETFDRAMIEVIDEYQPDLVVLAGFMRILSSAFVQHYQGRLINIHPSLLPKYKGTRTHQRALEAGDKEHGVSVHFVTEELDGGPVVRQAVVDILPGDDADSLAARVADEEHKIYPEVVSWFARKRLELTDSGVLLDGSPLGAEGVRSKT